MQPGSMDPEVLVGGDIQHVEQVVQIEQSSFYHAKLLLSVDCGPINQECYFSGEGATQR